LLPPRRPSGFTLLELVIALALSLAVGTLAVSALIELDRDQAKRQKVTELQTRARLAIGVLEDDLRHASLAAGSGVVWTTSAGTRVSRPAAQVFWNVQGTGFLDVKPNTDVVLVVGARRSDTLRTALVGDLYSSTGPIPVTDASHLASGQTVLLGDFGDAGWGTIGTVTASGSAQQLTLSDTTNNVLPGLTQRLRAGAAVRVARARLYYVDTSDELVQLTLTVPRAPASVAEISERAVLGRGFENLKLDCRIDNLAGGFSACPDALASDAVRTESQAAFGNFGASGTHQGPAFTASNAGLIRMLMVDLAVRSQSPLATGVGDPKVSLGVWSQQTLPVGGGSDTAEYVRRVYRITTGVRNTSLGAI
jgi:prepilin-type N-terminal cleavage/methylation domain-containing protein